MSIAPRKYHGPELKCAGAPMCQDCADKQKEKKITGYFDPYAWSHFLRMETEPQPHLVGCRNCRVTWTEMRPFPNMINGPQYCYDRCSECSEDPNANTPS